MTIDLILSLKYTSIALFIFLLSWVSIYLYIKVALKQEILASPNSRTLHDLATPSGGGVVFSFFFLICIFLMWVLGLLSSKLIVIIGIGSFFASILGFLDDKNNLKATKKFFFQIIISSLGLFFLDWGPLFYVDFIPNFIAIPVSVIFLVWVVNAYNFMDGVDGMAASGALFASLAVSFAMILMGNFSEVTLVLLLLAIIISSFLFFNWPPASLFMGDSGSIFLGHFFGVLVFYSTMNHEISIWTWVIVFSYFIADTSVTQFLRLVLIKKWYLPHRSHAYQNLARVSGSHLKLTGGLGLYNLLWTLPLVIYSVLYPELAIFCSFLAVIPGTVVTFIYGPIFSSS